MTPRLDKIKTDKVRGPNSKLVQMGPRPKNENKQSSLDKIWRLQYRFRTGVMRMLILPHA